MAEIGTQDDMLARQKSVLPRTWFPDVSPVLDGVLSGFAYVAALLYALMRYTRQQTRLGTASDGFLDLLAYDFFRLRFQRKLNEADASFRARIGAEIFRPRNTRAAIILAIEDLTGKAPRLFEPANPVDTGGYATRDTPALYYGMGWNCAGRWGSRSFPGQIFITAYRPAGQGVANVSGYGMPAGGYGAGAIEYVGQKMISGPISDADIYRHVSITKAAGVLAWVDIESTDNEFYADEARADQAQAY